MAGATKPGNIRDQNINIRASRSQKALIDRAAHALGRNRSDLILETACREADILLDRRYFALPPLDFQRFTRLFDKPPASNPKVARLLRTRTFRDK